MKALPMILRFRSGWVTPLSFFRKSGVAFFVPQAHLEMIRKKLTHRVLFAITQQAVIDKDTGQLIANGTMNQGCGHTGINAATQAEDDLILPNLFTDLCNRLVEVTRHRPVFATATDAMDKILDDLRAFGRVDHLRMKLKAVALSSSIFHRSKVGILGGGNRLETFGESGQLVAM